MTSRQCVFALSFIHEYYIICACVCMKFIISTSSTYLITDTSLERRFRHCYID